MHVELAAEDDRLDRADRSGRRNPSLDRSAVASELIGGDSRIVGPFQRTFPPRLGHARREGELELLSGSRSRGSGCKTDPPRRTWPHFFCMNATSARKRRCFVPVSSRPRLADSWWTKLGVRSPDDAQSGFCEAQTEIDVVERDREVRFVESAEPLVNFARA